MRRSIRTYAIRAEPLPAMVIRIPKTMALFVQRQARRLLPIGTWPIVSTCSGFRCDNRRSCFHVEILVQFAITPHSPYFAVQIIVCERASPDETHSKAIGRYQRVVRYVVSCPEHQRANDISPYILVDPGGQSIVCGSSPCILVP